MSSLSTNLVQPRVLGPLLLLGLLGTCALALASGAYAVEWGRLGEVLRDALLLREAAPEDMDALVVRDLRLPRLLLAVVVGASLAVCGALMQGMFRNPLADPALLGVSGGAAFGASLAMVWASSLAGPWATAAPALAACAGGTGVSLLVVALGRVGRNSNTSNLLLTGIALQALMAAATGAVIYVADDAALRSITFWMMGGLGGASWGQLALVCPVLLLALLASTRLARSLDALLLGESEAGHLGVSVRTLKRRLVLLSTVLVAVATAVAGIIGFVGLVVPHIVRLLCGPGHRHLLPLTALLGALLLLTADTAARTLIEHQELPVGIFTTACGAPFFLWLVARGRRQGGLG